MSKTVNVDFVTKKVYILVNDSDTEALAADTAIAAAEKAVVAVGTAESTIDAYVTTKKTELDDYTDTKETELGTVAQPYVDAAAQSATEAQTILNAILSQYGYPFQAATAAAMTDTTKIYVYTGSETGYTNGNWYYYNGSSWVSGGVYNAIVVQTDTTLSVLGDPADAKTVGDKLKAAVIGGYTYITNSSKASICNSDLNNLPINTIYTVNHDVFLDHTPTRLDGTQVAETYGVVTLSCSNTRANRVGQFQLLVTNVGETWVRGYSSGGWSAWRMVNTNNSVIGDGTITDSNKSDICNADFDDIPVNTVYSMNASVVLSNAPTTFSSVVTIITLSDSKSRSLAAGTVQYVIENGGERYFRMYGGGGWSSWKNVLDGAVVSKGAVTASDYSGHLYNILDNGIYFVDPDDFDDAPFYSSTNCTLLVFKINTSFALQVFVGTANYGKFLYQRLVRTNGTIYRDWYCSDGDCRNILAIGDSICNGGRNNNKGFVGDVGIPYTNAGVSNARISATGTYWIEQQLIDRTEASFDAIIMEGGINDYMTHVPLGTLSSVPIKTTDTASINALDLTTVLGALEHLFISCIAKYPNADRFFLITHKANHLYNGNYTYYPATANSAGYNQTELHDAIVNACKLYNVQVIDVFAESPINTFFDEYVSPTAWADDPSVTDLYWVDHDGLHPLNYGYKHGYVPLILKALKATSHK